MAFSQKHSGKVFVPWFNQDEWKYVYTLLASKDKIKMVQALDILKIWKIRTPLLSAGVEGTLILLETLLADLQNLSEFQFAQIYSISLMRFLNICAANSDKQGTFHRTVSKNDLPKWLIDIRHDIAHNHKLPSKLMVELALNESFNWLIEKYWKVQNETISNYYVDAVNTNTKIVDTLNAYVRLNVNVYKNLDMDAYDEALMEKINYIVSKRYNKTKTDSQGLIVILEEMLKQELANPVNKNMTSKVADILITNNALFATHLEKNEEGVNQIPTTFKDLWRNLLNILFENGFLVALLNRLQMATTDITDQIPKIATCWIMDILNGILKLQCLKSELYTTKEQNNDQLGANTSKMMLKSTLEQNPEFKDCIEFECENIIDSFSLEDFEKCIVQYPNVHSVKFLYKVMLINHNSDRYKNFIVNMANYMCESNDGLRLGIPEITIKTELPIDIDVSKVNIPPSEEPEPIDIDVSEVNIPSSEQLVTTTVEDIEMTTDVPNDKRWTLITDTQRYKDCPLGILPHQRRNENPFFIIDR